ncbi:hypothetical protein NDU88_004428 [Pleurodeles waltl]|uniref:Uncharacterized protein n=1 Tax=Pleurodeles waltl TaxID=8319 RepID=A0AAV7VJB0_PLEWA|nr:hypothetical protein NDU88_004428 [Pleurodeles waltl]
MVAQHLGSDSSLEMAREPDLISVSDPDPESNLRSVNKARPLGDCSTLSPNSEPYDSKIQYTRSAFKQLYPLVPFSINNAISAFQADSSSFSEPCGFAHITGNNTAMRPFMITGAIESLQETYDQQNLQARHSF